MRFLSVYPSLAGRIVLERLRRYASEINPIEYIWAQMKLREQAHLCARTIREVREAAGIDAAHLRKPTQRRGN